MAFRTAINLGFSGKLFAVNKRGQPAHGINGVTSCTLIGEPVDVAFIFVPIDAVSDALADAAAAGIKHAVVLTSGYSETGDAGAALERELVEGADRVGMRFIGPNTVGTMNYRNRSAVGALPPSLPLIEGRISLVGQSGAMVSFLSFFAHQQGIGLNNMIATGNEAQVRLGEIVEYLVDDDTTSVIVIYAQMIRDPDRFAAAAERAMAKRKPIVCLKVGASDLAAKVAMSHTGALVGDDRVFDAVCRRYGVIRVDSIESAMLTASLLDRTGALQKPGVAILSISGGACEIGAERAAAVGVDLPAFAPETVAALRAALPAYAATHNPLDITGAAIRDPSIWAKAVTAVAADPQIGLVVCATEVPSVAAEDHGEAMNAQLGPAMAALDKPAVLMTNFTRPMTEYTRDYLARTKIPFVLPGIDYGVAAIGKVTAWSEAVASSRERPRAPELPAAQRPRSERETLAYLKSFGVPVIPQEIVQSADDAVRAARAIGGPVALKIASPDISHKTEIGGVQLGLHGDAAVAAGFEAIMASARDKAPMARLDGVLVAPMRDGGTELFVGVKRDPQWGPLLAVGLGGVWIEVLEDTAIRLLPVDRRDVSEMFASLKGAKLLDGYRNFPAVDRAALVDVTLNIAEAALALGPELESLEINPLMVRGSVIEALDGLALYRDQHH